MTVSWREEMATGDDVIDSQHRELLRRIDDLLKGVRALKGREELGRLFWFLKGYVRKHFRAEEELQLNCGFPGYHAHKAEHEAFFLKVQRLESLYAAKGGSTVVVVSAIRTMCDWQRNHFQQMDRVMIEFVRQVAESKLTPPVP